MYELDVTLGQGYDGARSDYVAIFDNLRRSQEPGRDASERRGSNAGR